MRNTKICDMNDSEFSAALSEAMSLSLTEDELFYWLYSTTMAIYNLDPKTHPCSKGKVKRWTDLADLWDSCAEANNELDMFMLAMHKIHWGVLPKNCPSNIPVGVIDAIADELLKNSSAYRGWKKSPSFDNALDFVIYQTRPIGTRAPKQRSRWYLKYVRRRTLLSIVYKNTPPPIIDLSNTSYREYRSAKKHASIFADVKNYESVIINLVPEASQWDANQWCDEKLLYKKLKAHYGLDIASHSSDFDSLITFLISLWCYGRRSISALLLIEDIPDTLMQIVWPQNTKYEVSKLLCFAHGRVKATSTYLKNYSHFKSYCTQEYLKDSWLYNRCLDWVQARDYDGLAPKTKSIVFEVGINLSV